MPRKLKPETQKEQSARFNKAARKLVADGELNPIDADETMERLLKKGVRKPPESSDSD